MKKTLFAVLALAAVAACNKAEVVEQSAANAIAFDNAFVDNAVKSVSDPSFTNEKLFSDFAVFGFVEGATLFDGTQVKKEKINNDLKSDWQYTGTQYWIAGAQYNFSAVAPFTGNWTKTTASKDGVELSFTNNGTTDLLYATAAQEGKVSGNTAVSFSFRHVLSKVKFSFENGYNATNATIRVKDIAITNPHKTANVVLTDATAWNTQATADGFTLAFGMATDDESTTDVKENVEVAYAYGKVYESQNERFLIPSSDAYEYNASFKVELLVSNQVVKTYNHTATVKFAPAPGTCYDIKAVINAQNIDPNHAQEPIEFTVATLPGWGTASDVNATVNNNKN